MEFLSGDSRNPSRGEGGDVEFGARTSKHIFVFVFDYLSNLLSFISCITLIYLFIYMLDIVIVHTLVLNLERN